MNIAETQPLFDESQVRTKNITKGACKSLGLHTFLSIYGKKIVLLYLGEVIPKSKTTCFTIVGSTFMH